MARPNSRRFSPEIEDRTLLELFFSTSGRIVNSKIARRIGVATGAIGIVTVGPSVAEEASETLGAKIKIENVTYADCVWNPDGSQTCTTPTTIVAPPTSTIPSVTVPGGGTVRPPGNITTTTIPWERRDDDGDGVKNGDDYCQQTSGGEVVDESGCSLGQRDDDLDGLMGNVELYIGTDPMNADTDGDGKTDGVEVLDANGVIYAPSFLDTDGDGRINPLESDIDVDGDRFSPETGDPDELDPCIPSLDSPTCDFDTDGKFGLDDANPTVPYADVDGDEVDDTGLGDRGDPDLTDGPDGDRDLDGVPNEHDDQNRQPKDGEQVDKNGVIIPATIPPTAPTTSIESAETASETQEDNGVLVLPNADTPSTNPVRTSSDTIQTNGGGLDTLQIAITATGGLAVVTLASVIFSRRRRGDDPDSVRADVYGPSSGSSHGIPQGSGTILNRGTKK